ncbi:odorant receptor 47a-like isoform X1 [Cotesia glomerata]|uniref:odorant receptor 47a-like isoform X1 n=1 Tax=Cotesia glomerata TaxID=32391 RepID=UPI001D00BE61|nr:odorant receptor 47a-like isoform X1 [Cotesia glomerata]
MLDLEMTNIESDIPSCKQLFNVELFVMKCVGLSSLERAFEVDKNYKIRALKCWEIFLCIAGIFFLSSLIYSLVASLPYYFGKDFSMTCFIISVAFSMSMTLMRLLRIWTCRKKVYQIFGLINKIWEQNTRKRVHLKAQIMKVVDTNKSLRHMYLIVAFILNICYSMRPYIMLLTTYFTLGKNETMTFTEQAFTGVVYPVRTDTRFRYVLLMLMELHISYFGSAYIIIGDMLFVFLTTVLTIHFMVLADDYVSIIDIYRKNNNNLSSIDEVIKRHCSLLYVCQQITYLYSPIVMAMIILNGIDLCCTIFSFQQDFAAGRAEISLAQNLPHALLLISQMIIYCNCAHITTEQIESLTEAVYNSRWVEGDKKVAKAVIILMINTQREYNFTAYGFFILNRQQLTQLFNSTMSYFMLLRNFM